jgi:predicted RecA/RadA family phage recombinase
MADNEGRSLRNTGKQRQLSEATISPYEVLQTVTGEAGVFDAATSVSSGNYFELTTRGIFNVVKTSGIVILKGGRVYWDHSANAATYKKVNDRDFYIGRAAAGATSAAVVVEVDLNINPPDDIDLMRDPYTTVPVGTQALDGFLPPVRAGGALHFELTATSEAQKVDAISVDGFAASTNAANAIVEFAFRVINDGAGTVVDVSMGIANATHATDADAITESVFIHLDANNTNINAESDDGITEVAATDTTTDYTEGATNAVRKEVWFDMADAADVQIYVDGVNVLPSTVFDVDAAVGPWKLFVHVEKTTGTEVYELAVDWMRVRFSEQ